MQGGTFLSFPLTERVAKIRFGPDAPAPKDMLSVGLQRLTEDDVGLKIVPSHHVVVAIGQPNNVEERAFALDPSMARDIAKLMLVLADEAERLDVADR
jgi:hypothetical protein